MCWDWAVGGMTPTVLSQLRQILKERSKPRGAYSPTPCSSVGALSVIAGHFRGKVARAWVLVSSTHCPLVFLRHKSTGGG